jgi:hypothetical protein
VQARASRRAQAGERRKMPIIVSIEYIFSTQTKQLIFVLPAFFSRKRLVARAVPRFLWKTTIEQAGELGDHTYMIKTAT